VLAAFAGNLAIAMTKAIAAYVTGSGALVAETAHSVADSVNQILLYVGIRRSVQPPTERHPLGHGKERYFWALIVALFLFFGGGIFSMYEAYERLTHPQELGAVWVGFVVLGLSMVFEAFSLSVAVREVRHAAREDEELLRAHLDRPKVDDLVDPRLSRDGDAEGFDDFLGRGLADDEAACAPCELVRDIDKDESDHRAGKRIEAVIVRQHG